MDVHDRQGLPGLAYPEAYLKRLSSDLSLRFAGIFSLETIERYVLEDRALGRQRSRAFSRLDARQ